MIQTVKVRTRFDKDSKGESLLQEIKTRVGKKGIKKIETARVYRLEGINEKEAQLLAEKLLHENITQIYSLNAPLIKKAAIIEIGYQPGVMNPEVASIIKSAHDLGINLLAADSSTEYGFFGTASRKELKTIIAQLTLFNPIIEHIVEKEPQTLLTTGKVGTTKTISLRKMNENELMNLSKDRLFLDLAEMKVIQNYFIKIKRDPTDAEVEALAQTWSEHSGHKTFKAKLIVDGVEKKPLIKRLMEEALKHNKYIVSAFEDNSGAMEFYDGYAISGKGETHNSPSAIEPYGGAMTGSGGVFRDIVGTGLGAKTIASTDIFCLGPWDLPSSELPKGSLHPAYTLKKVVAAVKDYGNRIGIPTNNGSFHFHRDFRVKPTVLVGAYGILPAKKAKKGAPQIGDYIVSVGGRVGRDGIHGATFSSAEMTDRTSTVNAQAVQIGNAIEEKRMFDAIIEAREKNLIRALQDSGGGGLSSAIGEMGEKTGVLVHLENERVKYPGLSPWEIWMAESQERMILAIPKNKFKEFENICKKYNVELSNLGIFDGSKRLKVLYNKEVVIDIDMEFLHHGLPQRKLISNFKFPISNIKSIKKLEINKNEWNKILKKIVSHGNICSKEPIVRLYDHSVQGTNDLQPYSGVNLDAPNDAAIVRPFLDKPYGVVVAHGLNPVLNTFDSYWGSIWASVEALSNYVAVGGNYKESSLINNYIWPFPDEESLYSLDQSVDAVVTVMKTFKIPVISGKDSLSSTYRGKDGKVIKIPPTLCISVFGRIPDTTKTVTSDFKKEGSVIVLVGKQDLTAMAGSIFNEVLFDEKRSFAKAQDDNYRIPHCDLKNLPKVFETMHAAIVKGELLSTHDISEGGVFVSIFEMCIGADMGAHLEIKKDAKRILFNETAGCFVVEVENEKVAQRLFKNIPYQIIGKTVKEKIIEVFENKNKLLTADVDELKKAWKEPMRKIFSARG